MDKNGWRPIETLKENEQGILLLGESVPDHPYVRAGTKISGSECADLGYHEFVDTGGFLIFNDESDFYIEGLSAVQWFLPIPALKG